MTHPLRIATRASRLARWQTDHVAEMLRAHHPGLEIEIIEVTTTGDVVRDRALSAIGGTGVFTKELERRLLTGGADIAIHSLKDMETTLPDGLTLLALPERQDPRDALLARAALLDGAAGGDRSAGAGGGLAGLPPGSCIGTSSIRRRAQLRACRTDLRYTDLRGNVPSRLAKLERGENGMDATLVARAGLERLGLAARITATIDPDVLLPAVGQGALAIEGRAGDARTRALVQPLDDAGVRVAVTAERAWLRQLHGGCQVPAGALATAERDGRLRLRGVVCALDGSTVIRGEEAGRPAEAAAIGERLAQALLARGADAIVAEVEAFVRRQV